MPNSVIQYPVHGIHTPLMEMLVHRYVMHSSNLVSQRGGRTLNARTSYIWARIRRMNVEMNPEKYLTPKDR